MFHTLSPNLHTLITILSFIKTHSTIPTIKPHYTPHTVFCLQPSDTVSLLSTVSWFTSQHFTRAHSSSLLRHTVRLYQGTQLISTRDTHSSSLPRTHSSSLPRTHSSSLSRTHSSSLPGHTAHLYHGHTVHLYQGTQLISHSHHKPIAWNKCKPSLKTQYFNTTKIHFSLHNILQLVSSLYDPH